ncbi:Dynein, 70 kDa intermediate chain, flagellar outer arm [Cymbomonas tetramitiformis]|uniref:Dynein, 70 kDa intermediate chain, flagellar outer arm n=1 Tax=Cymbomonas tetramitiformis TaxID=36881 RepID=A0AAE0KPV8_9CHLO|nr:Dynein, 70 kDa intermediate chain, flagellar outer arm [Cymbomonas tetramitiformis]
METIYYMYTKQRKEFGRHPNFSDEAPGILFEILPEREVKLDLIERNPCVANVQVVPEMSEHEVNTEKVVFKNTGQFHKEGGWPKDIDPTEVEHTLRYRKKVEKDEDYLHAIAKLGGQTEELVKQNNAVDIYEEYFEGHPDLESSEKPYANTLLVFRDPSPIKRAITHFSCLGHTAHGGIAAPNLSMRTYNTQ